MSGGKEGMVAVELARLVDAHAPKAAQMCVRSPDDPPTRDKAGAVGGAGFPWVARNVGREPEGGGADAGRSAVEDLIGGQRVWPGVRRHAQGRERLLRRR
jgi:hypothetical protein